jgi:hypothetical protein
MKYQNKRFEIELPDNWRAPGLLGRLVGMDKNPEFYGPNEEIRVKYDENTPRNEAALKFAIGPIYPEPSVEQHQKNLESIAMVHRHNVIKTGTINVLGKEHATIVYEVPRIKDLLVYRLKNYHLIFNQTEFVATANMATLEYSFWPSEWHQHMPSSLRHSPQITGLQAVYMFEEDYDDIIKTFKLR